MDDETENVLNNKITEQDRKLARMCLNCPVCNYARRKQRGLIFWFVTRIESKYCPNCKAYEKVYGRPAHQPLPGRD
jgi:hypothetical protein